MADTPNDAPQGYTLTKTAVQRTAKTVGIVLGNAGKQYLPGHGDIGDDGHWARITGSTRVSGGDWAWKYGTEQVRQTMAGRGIGSWEVVDGGITCSSTDNSKPTAYNTMEESNGSSGRMGCGVTVANLPPTVSIQPIQDDVIVWLRHTYNDDTTDEYRFTAANGVDGPCPSDS